MHFSLGLWRLISRFSVIQPERHSQKTRSTRAVAAPLKEYLLAGGIFAAATGLFLRIMPFTGYQAISLLYLLLVVISGMKLGRGPTLAVAASSAVIWNLLFIPPRFTLYIDKIHDAIMFCMFFVVALAMGHLTNRLRRSEIAERQKERRTAAMYELVHQAAFATDLSTGLRAAVHLIESIFGTKAALLLRDKDHNLSNVPHPASALTLSDKDKSLAARVFSQGISVEKFTGMLPDSAALHLPLQGRAAVMGVLSVSLPPGGSFDRNERDLLEAFAVLIGLILEKDHVVQAFKRAEILEASDRLRRTLLESVSHELKTPLAAVQTGIEAVANQLGHDERKQSTVREIQAALRRLHRVINNLLDMTRIESEFIRPKLDWSDVAEIIQAAVDIAGESLAEHRIVIDTDESLPMVKVDDALLEQCLCNLLINAASWSPPGSTITTVARLNEGNLVLSVLDKGTGIREVDLPHLFEPFYRARDSRPGGTGLGLAIVDGFVRAHGGKVNAVNRPTGGAEFVITLQVEILKPGIVEVLR